MCVLVNGERDGRVCCRDCEPIAPSDCVCVSIYSRVVPEISASKSS